MLFFKKHSAKKNEKGFTLIELAVVIFVVGIMLGLAISFALPVIRAAQRIETEEKMGKIADALHYYAVRNYRLPCPATPNRNLLPPNPPFGAQSGSGTNGDQIPAACPQTIGAVPWRTLGLNSDMVVDGYGNAFTYAISPAFSQDITNAQNLNLHPSCRTMEWYTFVSQDDVGLPADAFVFIHKNPRKALFCCPGTDVFAPTTDIQIQDAAGNPSLSIPRVPAAGPGSYISDTAANTTAGTGTCPPLAGIGACNGIECCSAYNLTITTPFSVAPNASINPQDRVTAVAYTIISHGQNGNNAAYNLNNGNRPAAAPADPNEQENWDDGDDVNIFRDLFQKDDNYDDILLWRTQDLIFADQRESCAVP